MVVADANTEVCLTAAVSSGEVWYLQLPCCWLQLKPTRVCVTKATSSDSDSDSCDSWLSLKVGDVITVLSKTQWVSWLLLLACDVISAYLRNHTSIQTLSNFLSLLSVQMTWFCSGSTAICHVLPVVWMMSCCPILGPMAGWCYCSSFATI